MSILLDDQVRTSQVTPFIWNFILNCAPAMLTIFLGATICMLDIHVKQNLCWNIHTNLGASGQYKHDHWCFSSKISSLSVEALCLEFSSPAKDILNIHSAATASPTLELLQPLLAIPVIDLPLLLVRQHLICCNKIHLLNFQRNLSIPGYRFNWKVLSD